MKESKLLVEVSSGLFLLKSEFDQESVWRSDRCYKFIYSANGTMTYQTNRNELQLNEQQFIVLNPHEQHRQLAVDQQKFLIEIEPAFLNQVAKSLCPVHYDIRFATCTQHAPQLTKWVYFVTEFVQLEKENSPASTELFLDHSLTQLALLLVKNAIGTHTDDFSIKAYQSIHPQLYKVIQALKEDYAHPWTLEEMAAISSLSKYQFAHCFNLPPTEVSHF